MMLYVAVHGKISREFSGFRRVSVRDQVLNGCRLKDLGYVEAVGLNIEVSLFNTAFLIRSATLVSTMTMSK